MAGHKLLMSLLTVAILAFVLMWLLPVFGIAGASVVAVVALAAGLYFIGSAIGVVKSPLTKQTSAIIGIIGIFAFVFMSGISLGGFFPAGQIATTTQPPVSSGVITGVSLAACTGSVNPQNLGDAATGVVNAYDTTVDNPTSAAVNSEINVFHADSIASAGTSNFVAKLTDTTAGSLTGIQVGDVVTLVGNRSQSYYATSKEGICITGASPIINLDVQGIQTEANLQSTLYDSTGAVEASTTVTNSVIDYNESLSANEEKTYFYRIKNNGANAGYNLGGIAFAELTNVSNVKPSGADTALFDLVPTPDYMKNIVVQMNSTGTNTQTVSYTPYKLKTPVLLTEFTHRQYQVTVKASANDPIENQGAATMSGVAISAFDVQDVKASSGSIVKNSIDDGTSSSLDVGLLETFTSPEGNQAGVLVMFR